MLLNEGAVILWQRGRCYQGGGQRFECKILVRDFRGRHVLIACDFKICTDPPAINNDHSLKTHLLFVYLFLTTAISCLLYLTSKNYDHGIFFPYLANCRILSCKTRVADKGTCWKGWCINMTNMRCQSTAFSAR